MVKLSAGAEGEKRRRKGNRERRREGGRRWTRAESSHRTCSGSVLLVVLGYNS